MKMCAHLSALSTIAGIGVVLAGCLPVPSAQETSTVAPSITALSPTITFSAEPTGTQPRASSTTTLAKTTTPTPISPGKVLKDILVELKQSPEIACSRSEIWKITSPYTAAQPFLSDERVSYRSPRWSHDGTRIAYIEEAGAETRIELRSKDSGLSPLSSSSFPYVAAESSCTGLQIFSWSPSNQWLVFEQVNYIGKFFRHLYVLDISSGQSILVDESFYGFPPAVWSPEGDILAYVSVAYDASGRRVSDLGIRLVQIKGEGVVLRSEIAMPDGFEVTGRSDRIRGLVWRSNSKLLAVITSTIGDDPARLYEVDVASQAWKSIAEYERRIDTEKYPPSQVYVSPTDTLVAWAGNDLLVLDASNWQEHDRIQTNWLGGPLLAWTNDSNNHSVLVFNNADSFWVYDPDLRTRERLFSAVIFSGLTSVDMALAP